MSAAPPLERPPSPAAQRPAPSPSTSPVAWAALTALVAETAYLLLRLPTPDLPAQVARAEAASRGAGLWWAGWYGGLDTPSYSLLSAHLMALVGVRTVGVVATAALCVGAADLVRTAPRPRTAAVALSLAACANLFSSRLTFAAGLAVVVASFCCLRRGWTAAALLLAALSGLVSPLAALCEGLGLAALFLCRPGQRRVLLLAAVATTAPVAALSLAFRQPSSMPYGADLCLYAVLTCLGVLVARVPREVGALAVLSAVLAVGAHEVDTPIGSNAARMPMLLAAALVVGFARRGVLAALLAVALVVWPVRSLVTDVRTSRLPTAQGATYAGLLAHLPARGAAVQRVEVVDPLDHGASHWVARRTPLARGWERQADAARNHLFYGGRLDPQTYRDWLQAHAVGWVAVPSGPLDYASRGERRLVLGGLAYLQPVWHDRAWTLYRVIVPAPAATGVLTATALTDTAVRLGARAAGSGVVRASPSGLLVVRATDGSGRTGCVRPGPGDSVTVTVPSAGAWELTSSVRALVRSVPGC